LATAGCTQINTADHFELNGYLTSEEVHAMSRESNDMDIVRYSNKKFHGYFFGL